MSPFPPSLSLSKISRDNPILAPSISMSLACTSSSPIFLPPSNHHSLQLNVGIIAACIPTLKPLLRSHSRQTQTPRRSAYADIEHAATIGSARQLKPGSRREGYRDTNGTNGTKKGGMITTTTTTVDEAYEMMGCTRANGTLQAYGAVGQIRHGDAGGRRMGGGGDDKREILCTTEVMIDRELRRET